MQKIRNSLFTAALLATGLFSSPSHAAVEDEVRPTLQGLRPANDSPTSAAPAVPALRERVVKASLDAIGTLYHWGGDDPDEGFDCSGLVRFVFHKTAGLNLPRTSRDQHTGGQSVARQQLQPGDLVFFNGTVRTPIRIKTAHGHHKSLRTVISHAISHVGIYIGDNQFVHSPVRGERVRIDNLDGSYWAQHYAGASRYLTPQAVAQAVSFQAGGNDDDQP